MKLKSTLYRTLVPLMVIFSCVIVIIQAYRVLTLVDYSYMIENAYRIYVGQKPYKDFILMYPVGTFYLIVFFWKIFGCNEISIILLQIITQTLYCLLSYLIFNQLTSNRKYKIIMLGMVLLSGQVITPNPNYDILEMISVLLVLNIWIAVRRKASSVGYMILGVSTGCTMLFKQNVALVFIVLFICVLIIDCFYKRCSISNTCLALLFILFDILVCIILVFASGLEKEIIYQLFIYPAGERNILKIVAISVIGFFNKLNRFCLASAFVLYIIAKKLMKREYARLFLYSWIFFVGPCVMEIGLRVMVGESAILYNFSTCWYYVIIWSVVSVLYELKSKVISEESIFVTLILVFIGANIASQGFTGSTYALYPVMGIILLIIYEHYTLIDDDRVKVCAPVCITMGLCVIFITNARLQYVDFAGERNTSKNIKLSGLAAYGDYLLELDELVEWIEINVNKNQTFVELPGEDPIYFLTEDIPPLKYFHLNSTMFPYDIQTYAQDCIENNVTYIILKDRLQNNGFIDYSEMVDYISNDYELYDTIDNYIIYRIK